MNDVLNTTVVKTPLDREGGALGPKRLVILVGVLIVVGALVILLGQQYLQSKDTWEATITGVTEYTVNFTFDEESGDIDVASYPAGMELEVGDRVLIKTDVETGNEVVEIVGQ